MRPRLRRYQVPPIAALGGVQTLLLDLIATAPTGAYSTRKIRAAYAASCIRVRRSSDNAEQDIGFSGNVFDIASLLAFCGAGDGFLVTWYDQSGNSRNMTQATAGLQAQMVSSGALITTINGQPSIQFDGTDDRLVGAAPSSFISANAYSILASSRPTAGGAGDLIYYSQRALVGDITDGNIALSYGATKFVAGHWDGNEEEITIAVSYPSTKVAAVRFTSSGGGSLDGWLNGGAATNDTGSGAASTAGTMAIGHVFTGARFQGAALEVLMFNSQLSLTEINSLGAEMANYAGATWTTAT